MQTIEAVWENGVFRPLTPPELVEGQQVKIVVEAYSEEALHPILQLAFQVYEGLSPEEIAEIEAIALDRSNFFTERE